VRYATGHGTGNDFVLIPDLDGVLELSGDQVRALCDRKAGIGADGVLRITRGRTHDFFMDYRNADGSLAQMCGNGIRVMARYLVEQGLADPAGMDIATRGGVRHIVRRPDGLYDVSMGPAQEIAGVPSVAVGRMAFPASAIAMPNPHAVVFVGSLDAAGSLDEAPDVTPDDFFPDGVNVEFVQEIAPGHIAMRVHERGSGETMSCGTGACAAAYVARRRPGTAHDGPMRVDVPGGTLLVDEADDGMHLIGPAEIVAEGELSPGWVARWQ